MKKERWPLNSTYNTRDLGGYPLPGGGVTSDCMLRSDYFTAISPEDQKTLLDGGVTLVIDFRDEEEAERLPSVFAGREDVAYRRISLIPPEDVRQLGAGLGDEGGYLFMMGNAYIFALDKRKKELAETLRAMLAHPEGKTLFHCSAGKDRTGVVAALLLLLAGAREEDVVADYALTQTFLAPIVPTMIAELRARDVVDEKLLEGMFAAPPENMQRMIDHLNKTYGGVEGYFAQLDLTAAEIAALRRLMGA